jgi:hypothetical protein
MDEKEFDPECDCGTYRCPYPCEKCPAWSQEWLKELEDKRRQEEGW